MFVRSGDEQIVYLLQTDLTKTLLNFRMRTKHVPTRGDFLLTFCQILNYVSDTNIIYENIASCNCDLMSATMDHYLPAHTLDAR